MAGRHNGKMKKRDAVPAIFRLWAMKWRKSLILQSALTLPSVSVSLNNLDPSPSWLWES
jgi:hypothetical protein